MIPWGPSKSSTKTASQSISCFCIGHGRASLQWATLSLKIAPSHGATWTPILYMIPWAHHRLWYSCISAEKGY